MQDALARAHAQIASARAYAYTTVSDLWTVLVSGEQLGPQERAGLRLMIAHVTDVCRNAVLNLFRACGGAAVHDHHPLQRRMREAGAARPGRRTHLPARRRRTGRAAVAGHRAVTARVLVTGCSSGLGRATALHLAVTGRRVIATVRSPKAQQALRDEARAAGLDLHIIRMDIRDAASVSRGLDEAGRLTGGIDALVNNAGVEAAGPMEHTTEEDLIWQLETNVVGTYRLTRAVLPAMRQARYGRLVFVSSLVGRAARPFLATCCASKYAVEGLAESLRWEMRPFGVSVSLVEPGRYRPWRPASSPPPP
jgi:NAD(P)-dependent dehydrogenase (short-subunit alcohol dehydrogenase family)